MKNPKTDTKDRIIKVSLFLFLKKGFGNVSISEIKKEANISSGGFYHYFNSKDDLLEEVEKRYVLTHFENAINNIKQIEGSFKEKLELILIYTLGDGSEVDKIDATIQDVESHKEYYILYLERILRKQKNIHILEEFNKELLNIYIELIDKAKKDGEFNSNTDSKKAAIFALSLLKGTIKIWLSLPDSSLKRIYENNLKLFLTNCNE